MFLKSRGIPLDRNWYNERTGKKLGVTECTYVRNSIHHPENTHNPRSDEAMLESSIKKLLSAI